MKRFQAVLCLALAAAAAGAAEPTLPVEGPHLNAGNLKFGASLSLTSNSFSNGASSYLLSASLPVQYFVIEGLSIGGTVDWSTAGSSQNGASQTSTVVSVGALASWYFWRHDRFAAFIEPQFFVNLRAPDLPTTVSVAGALSVEWFLNPSVGLGPGIVYAHQFGNGLFPASDLYRFFVEVLIYL